MVFRILYAVKVSVRNSRGTTRVALSLPGSQPSDAATLNLAVTRELSCDNTEKLNVATDGRLLPCMRPVMLAQNVINDNVKKDPERIIFTANILLSLCFVNGSCPDIESYNKSDLKLETVHIK